MVNEIIYFSIKEELIEATSDGRAGPYTGKGWGAGQLNGSTGGQTCWVRGSGIELWRNLWRIQRSFWHESLF